MSKKKDKSERKTRKNGLVKDIWRQIFSEFHILEKIKKNGFFRIAASTISKYHEVRLLTKYDRSSDLPSIFKDNKLSILPVSRREFIIGPFKAYKHIKDETDKKPIFVEFPPNIQSISSDKIISEQHAITAAYLSGMFNQFLCDDESPVLSQIDLGRCSAGDFKFCIERTDGKDPFEIEENGPQIEVDQCFENDKFIAVVEAKMFLDSDFLVRQLFFPFMFLLHKRNVTKPIKLVYFVYSDEVYKFFEFEAKDGEYNSLELVKQMSFTTRSDQITLEDIKPFLKCQIVNEPEVPFPQADNFPRILNMLDFFFQVNAATSDQIIDDNDFVDRQVGYYTNAMIYLGLLEKSCAKNYKISDIGRKIGKLRGKQRDLELVKKILQHSVFRACFLDLINDGRLPDKEMIVQHMKSANLYKINSDETFFRRSSTISGWIKWIASLIKED